MTTTHSIFSGGAGVEDAGITDASQTGLDILGSMTLMAWVRPSVLARRHSLITKWNGVSSNRSWLFEVTSGNAIGFAYSDDGTGTFGAVSAAITGVAINEWRHVAVVFISATPEVQFYLDGVPFGAPVATGGPGTILNGTASFRVGNFDPGAAGDNFRGHMDQIKVYDDERTAAEIQSEYQEAPIAGSNLQAGYSLDNVLTDISGNVNTLVNSGTSFVEGEVHGYGANDNAKDLIGGGATGGVFNYFGAGVISEVGSGGGGGGGSLTYRMRGTDTTLVETVFWSSATVDSGAGDYGGPGPVVDIVVANVLGT
jgi:hypothetical protein